MLPTLPVARRDADGAAASLRVPIDTASPYVVGIGASAGGLEALERFFDNVPKDSGMAFVVVQHLSPDFKSLMDEILGRRTPLPCVWSKTRWSSSRIASISSHRRRR
jgi:two-component system CheB/CheR fusion protein